MCSDTAEANQRAIAAEVGPFLLSYSRRDTGVATKIQKDLHHIGRRLGQLRALRVFRDVTDLGANPNLLGRVTDAMDHSSYLIVVLSPRGGLSLGRRGGRPLAGAPRTGPADVRAGQRSPALGQSHTTV